MPGKVKVKIVAGRNLPVMDRSNDTTDAYVEIKCGNTTHKTDVCRKSLNPQWNSEWFRFEMDDLELQDEPLQIRLMDHDTYSANDAIGKVYLDLNPLLTSTPKRKDDSVGKLISGWIPVYDTMHGIRGEVNLIVKLELFSDVNKFRQSSCGVKFFFTPAIPEGYYCHTIQGFVEELVVNDDPEYQWIDKIRTPRASNEARQTLFSKLSGEVQRRVGLKALELGGNAVIGYRQCFDLEGESGIVVRGIGTAVTLTKITEDKMSPTGAGDSCGLSRESPIAEENNEKSCSPLSNRSQTASLSTPTSTTHTNTFVSSSPTSLNTAPTNCTVVTTATSPTLTNTDTRAVISSIVTSSSNDNHLIPLQNTPNHSHPHHTTNSSHADSPVETKTPRANETNFPFPTSFDYNRIPNKFSYTSVNPSVYTTTTTFSIGNSRTGNGTTLSTTSTTKKEMGLPVESPTATSPKALQMPNGSSNFNMSALDAGFSHINVSSANNLPPTAIHRRSSESDLCLPPRSSGPTRLQVLTGNHGRNLTFAAGMCPGVYLDHFDVLEYPFITLTMFPPGFIYYIGGFVSAKSVKLLERMPNLDEPQSRDAWWTEARLEIRSHARSLGCNCVIGYEEKTTMCEDVCVLSVTGTAAIVSSSNLDPNDVGFATMLKSKFRDSDQDNFPKTSEGTTERTPLVQNESSSSQPNVNVRLTLKQKLKKLMGYFIPPTSLHCGDDGDAQGFKMRSQKTRHVSDGPFDPQCAILHRPLYALTVPNAPKLGRCSICKSARVPEALLSTIEIPVGLHITGKSCLIQAQVFRPKNCTKGEVCAKEVSDSLPFLEYEIYRRLINKLKVKGMNAIFGLQSQLCLGDKMMVAIASGTAVFVTGLPAPTVPLINTTAENDSHKVTQFQKVLQEAYDRNRELYEVQDVVLPTLSWMNPKPDRFSDGEESDGDESIPEIYLPDWISNDKNTYVLEVDDAEDIDIISVLIDASPPVGYHMNCTEHLVGFDDCRVTSQQMFTKVWRCRMPVMSLRNFTTYFDRLLRSICFKLRGIKPCNLTNLRFRIEIPEADEVQVAIIGLAVGLTERLKTTTTLENSKTYKSCSSMKNAGSEEGDINLMTEDEASQGQSNEGPIGSNSNNGIPTSFSTASMVASYSATGAVTMTTANTALKSTWSPGSTNSFSNLAAVPVSSPSHLNSGSTAHVNVSGGASVPLGASHTRSLTNGGSVSTRHSAGQPFRNNQYHVGPRMLSKLAPGPGKSRFSIEITPLSYIHGAKIERYLGNLNFFFIRETTSIRESGGLSGFMQNFIAEVMGIIRAHVSALGGNAMVSYFLSELALLHNPHKNQGQCLINVGGDVVLASYPTASQEDAINSS